jgi:hypothetical protein
MAAGIGRGRDLINSLSVEEAKSAEADKGLISAVEAAEARLAAAIKCDELGMFDTVLLHVHICTASGSV